jgi:hypothetical protein
MAALSSWKWVLRNSMSSPACSAGPALWLARQSETTKPVKPHWWRRMSVSSVGFSQANLPLTEL